MSADSEAVIRAQTERIAMLQDQLAAVRAEVAAERDALRATVEAALEVVAERDALKAGKWAGPWVPLPEVEVRFVRPCRHGWPLVVGSDGDGEPGWWWRCYAGAEQGGGDASSLDAAKAAADEALRSAGWFLVNA